MTPKTRIWVTSDQHFGHDKIIKYAKRPYKNPSVMKDVLINNWNNLVGIDDMVICIGDFAWNESSTSLFNLLKRLHGSKVLCKGNHDRLSFSKYLEAGFNFVCDSFVWHWSGKNILFVHDPNKVAKADYQKYDIIAHGHLHNKDFASNNGRFVNLSVEKTNYKPVLINSLVNKFYKHNVRAERKKNERDLELEYRNGVDEDEEYNSSPSDEDIEIIANSGEQLRSRYSK